MKTYGAFSLIAVLTMSCTAPSETLQSSPMIEIQTEDVERFYDLYESTSGRPTAAQLQRLYIEPGTKGLHHLTQVRNVNAATIARAVAEQPELYVDARTCLAALPRIRRRLRQTFDNLLSRYPEASRPPVTILIGRGRPFAIAGPGTGVQVALEAMCSDIAARYLNSSIDDRFVYTIVGQIGYWVSYRIAKAYYQNTPDREDAIREMIQMTDPHEFLARSGWRPGIALNLEKEAY